MIVSQSVLEHVEELKITYETLKMWLKPGGCMSHAIDFKSHGICSPWNGHLRYGDFTWSIIRGKRPYFVNRHTHSVHLNMMTELGFEIRFDIRYESPSELDIRQIHPRFRGLPASDIVTDGAFIQAVKN